MFIVKQNLHAKNVCTNMSCRRKHIKNILTQAVQKIILSNIGHNNSIPLRKCFLISFFYLSLFLYRAPAPPVAERFCSQKW